MYCINEYEEVKYDSACESNKLAKFINYEIVEEENIDPFNHLIKSVNYEDLTGDRNILKTVLHSGHSKIATPEKYIVLIHYMAYLPNLPEPFDATYLKSNRPRHFTLGNNELLPGLEIGVKTMKINEKARFIIKPKLAYNEIGLPPSVPPNSTILFDVHLIMVLFPYNYTVNIANCDRESFQANIIRVNRFINSGNVGFKANDMWRAIVDYKLAKQLLYINGYETKSEESEMMKHLNILYTNLCVSYMKVSGFKKINHLGNEAMKNCYEVSKNNIKLFFNWGKALRFLNRLEEAKKKLEYALRLAPLDVSIQEELKKIEKRKLFSSVTPFRQMLNNGTIVPY